MTDFEIVMVSRGHGRGHAVPDMAIARELAKSAPDIPIRFVSYAAGAEAYRACGFPVTDLEVEDNPPFLDMVVKLTRLFGEMNPWPRLIIAHEEFPVLPAAEIFEIPCVFITDFFTDPGHLLMQALKYASEVVFTGEPGVFTEPPYLNGRIHYIGRAVRDFEYSLSDRVRARTELGIPADAVVALFQPGAWVESRVPIAELLIDAWNLLPGSPKRLIWLTGRDHDVLSSKFGDRPDLMLLQADWKIDRLMAASDVLITKANRLTVYEAAAIGLPSISISNLANWPDDVAVARVPSNIALTASDTPEILRDAIERSIGSKPVPAIAVSGGVRSAASRIAHHIRNLQNVAS